MIKIRTDELPCESIGLHNPAIVACTKKEFKERVTTIIIVKKTNSQ
jgi:hypothetical protein